MCAKSKVLWFVALPALLLSLLVFPPNRGESVVSKEESKACAEANLACHTDCGKSSKECGPIGSKDYNTCSKDCGAKCELRLDSCIKDADKTAPKAPKTKVQPKVQPGGAETPKINPKVEPEVTPGGVETPKITPKIVPKDLPELQQAE